MSLLQRVSPFLSPHDRGYLHRTATTRSIDLFSTPETSPDIIMGSANEDSKEAKDQRKEGGAMSREIPDTFLSQYMKKPQHKKLLTSHEIYFKSIDKNRTDKTYDIYEKYLVNKNQPARKREADIHQRLHQKRNVEEDIIPIIRKRRDEESTKNKRSEVSIRLAGLVTAIESPADTDSYPETKLKQITKKLTKEFMECAIDDLINLLSRMLRSLINLNDKNVPAAISNPQEKSSSSNRVLTRYHSRTPPGISIHTYLTRLTKFNNFTAATLLTTIYYIDLLSHHYQPFFTLNSWTVHRFLLVATMLAQKLMEDFFYTNEHYAKVGGVAISELNCLELDFLNRVDWRCVPAKQVENGKSSIKFAKDVLDLYYGQLIQLMGKNISLDDEVIYFSNEDTTYYEAGGDDVEDDDDIEEEDEEVDIEAERNEEEEEEDGGEDETEFASPTIYNPSINHEKYNSMGFSVDNSSSPHLKRRFSVNFTD
mmetsp:Transcript_5994/g.7317  ORF Transcript_5994/g.7317 Transcript_5994/m.7317 type:complete len:481 (-) Transcript_5994:89-1531(-)